MNPRHPLGHIVRDGVRVGLRYERLLAHPVERVWRALTESEQLRHWFPCDIVGPREAGATVSVPFWPDVVAKYSIPEPVLAGEIITWDPPRTFAWRWVTDVVIYELHPDAAGTRLVLTTWIDDFDAGLSNTAAGYHVCLDQLIDLVDTDAPAPFIEQDPTPLLSPYAALVHDAGLAEDGSSLDSARN